MNLIDSLGRTCLDIAKENKNEIILNILNKKSKKAPELTQDYLNNLTEFYKKKSFARPSSSKHVKSLITTIEPKNIQKSNDKLEEDEEIIDSKKFKLSSSPVDDALKWMTANKNKKHNFELSLTGFQILRNKYFIELVLISLN